VILPLNPRRWHQRYLSVLKSSGHDLELLNNGSRNSPAAGLDLLVAMEQLLLRVPENIFEAVNLPTDQRTPKGDVVIDLSGSESALKIEAPCLTPLFDGRQDPNAVALALVDGRTPHIHVQLHDLQGTRLVASGVPAVADQRVVSRAADQIFARSATLLLRALRDLQRGSGPGSVEPAPAAAVPGRSPYPFAAAAGLIAERIRLRLSIMAGMSEHWVVGYRKGGDSVAWDAFSWRELGNFFILPDDGARFYADPFAIERDGTYHVFVEEFPYATRKGVISWFTFDDNGKPTTPQPVLECPYHLSYPFIFEWRGQIFMIPETGAAGRIEMYRADPFPQRWVLEKILVDNVRAMDATLLAHDGRLWMFAGVDETDTSSWDCLALFSSDDLFGEWRPHPANPVLFDARAARPAGAMLKREDGPIIRPAQNCSAGYGGGLSICMVDRLDDENYAQSVVKSVGPPPILGASGFHTWNRAGDLDVFDLKIPYRLAGKASRSPQSC
jgi:hypothetical protein